MERKEESGLLEKPDTFSCNCFSFLTFLTESGVGILVQAQEMETILGISIWKGM